MKKIARSLTGPLVALTLLTLGTTGCSTQKAEESTKKSSEETAKKTGKTEKTEKTESTEKAKQTSAKTGSNVIADLFAKGKKAEGISYEMTMTTPESKVTGNFWLAGKKTRTDIVDKNGQKMVMIIDMETGVFYSFQPSANQAIKFTDKKQLSVPGKTPLDQLFETDVNAATLLKDDTVNGMPCKVISVKENGKEIYRMWVSVDYGIPIRTELEGPNGRTVMEYKNVKIGRIADGVFKLPPGVKVTDLNSMNLNGAQ